MTAVDIIQKAQSSGVTLTLSNNQEILYRCQQSAIQELLPLLRTHKTELITSLATIANSSKPATASTTLEM